MKKKQLTRHIIMALAMSAAMGTTGMAMDAITDNHTETFTDSVTVENDKDTEASIKIENKTGTEVNLTTMGDGHDIKLESAGSGIRAQGSSTGSISLDSSNDNKIIFDKTESSKGNGIDADSAMEISLKAARDNIITSTAAEGDGVNAGKNNSGKVTLTAGRSNIIRVVSDGIYTESGSTNDEDYIAETGNNEITAGNNGVDHRGSGTIKLEAWNGQNKIIAAAGDGIRVDGTGHVIASAKENHIEAGDNGIQVGNGGQVSLTAETNFIKGVNNGVYVSGQSSKASMKGDTTIIVNDETSAKPSDTSGIHVSDGGSYVIEKTDGDNTQIEVTSDSKYVYGILAEQNGTVDIETGNFKVTATHNSELAGGIDPRAIYSEQSDIKITADGTVTIDAVGTNNVGAIANTNGVYVETCDRDTMTYSDSRAEISGDSIAIKSHSSGSDASSAFGLQAKSVSDEDKAELSLSANTDGILIESETSGSAYGVNVAGNAETVLTAKNGKITVKAAGGTGTVSAGIYVDSIDVATSEKEIVSKARLEGASTEISGNYAGIYAGYGKSYVDVTATQVDNKIKGDTIGIWSANGADVQITAAQGNNYITTLNEGAAGASGIYATNTTGGNMTRPLFTNNKFAKTVLEGKNNSIAGFNQGIYEYANSDVQLHAAENNAIQAKNYGIYSSFTSKTELTAGQGNYIEAGETDEEFGNAYAVYALDNGGFTGTAVTLSAEERNQLKGAVYASGTDTTVSLGGGKAADGSLESTRYNYVGSSAAIAGAGDLDTDDAFKGKNIISALYAEEGAQISVSGAQNVFRTYAANPTDTGTLERVLWAYKGADIDIDGATFISTDRYKETSAVQPGNSADIAIAAGTATNLTDEIVNAPITDRATVTLNYENFTDSDGTVYQSSITGDILAAYAGTVDIKAKDGSNAGISVTGNILSGNNGILNLDLGKGGVLTGRADDYGDAGLNTEGDAIDEGHAGTEFFNPAFSSTIYKGGEVNLTMGEGSTWNVTGQSWITRINTEEAASADSVFASEDEDPVAALHQMATIDLTSEFSDLEKGGHALTVYDMQGDAAFNMKLHADRSVSDMLYMKHAEGDYIINVVDAVTTEDMYAGDFDGACASLRSARAPTQRSAQSPSDRAYSTWNTKLIRMLMTAMKKTAPTTANPFPKRSPAIRW